MVEFFEIQFMKEFRDLMMTFRTETTLNIRSLPVPFKQPTLVEKLYVKDIDDEKYQILNNTFVIKRKRNSITQNIYRNNGEVKGETTYTAKEGNLLVTTQENLRLSFKYSPSDSNLEYVDYRVDNGVRSFIYSIPKKYLYRTQQTVLVMCQYPKKSHYGGLQIVLTNGYTLYLYIVSLKAVRETEGNIALVAKTGIDYANEIAILEKYWLKLGIIFSRKALELPYPVRGITNLGYKVLEPTMPFNGVDEYSLDERETMRRRAAY